MGFCNPFGMRKVIHSVVWGILFLILAFWAGAHPNQAFGVLGFLSFFIIGVTFVVEGFRTKKNRDHDRLPPT